MSTMQPHQQAARITRHHRTDGRPYSFTDKLLLGLDARSYLRALLTNPVNWLLLAIFSIGIPLILQRYLFGLASVTHGSNDYPWGLFLGFGLFGMVPLSASGFLLSTTVEIFGRHDFEPLERLALLNGLLGYLFAVIYLLVDLGMPWRLAYPMFISLGPAAVLFLVAWHVATYLSVQIAELVPAWAEWQGCLPAKRFVRSISLGLTVAGIILSTLHQGALGALFTYAPMKIHPLWISSSFQWIQFFCSSIFAGLSMVIIAAAICKWGLRWRCDQRFLTTVDTLSLGLGKGCAYGLITYLAIRLVGIAHDQEWSYLLTGWGLYFSFELLVGTIVPMALFAFAVKHRLIALVRLAALIAVLGVIWNRLNTAIIAYNWQLYQEIPHWKEIVITITLFALYFVTYRFLLCRLPILYQWQGKR